MAVDAAPNFCEARAKSEPGRVGARRNRVVGHSVLARHAGLGEAEGRGAGDEDEANRAERDRDVQRRIVRAVMSVFEVDAR